MCSPITVHPDAVGGLATELTALAAELHDQAGLCRSTADSLHSALEGHEGWTAGAAGTAWAARRSTASIRACNSTMENGFTT